MICSSIQIFVILVVKSRRMRGAGHVAQMVQRVKCIRGFGGEPEGKRDGID